MIHLSDDLDKNGVDCGDENTKRKKNITMFKRIDESYRQRSFNDLIIFEEMCTFTLKIFSTLYERCTSIYGSIFGPI